MYSDSRVSLKIHSFCFKCKKLKNKNARRGEKLFSKFCFDSPNYSSSKKVATDFLASSSNIVCST